MRQLDVYPIGPAEFVLPPHQALRRLCLGERPFLLDGAADADGLGRFSYGGCDPRVRHRDSRQEESAPAPPLRGPAPDSPLRRMQAVLAGWGPLIAVGLLGYDLGRSLERLPPRDRPDDLGIPAIDLAGYDALYRHDAATGESVILALSLAAAERLRRRLLSAPPPLPPAHIGPPRLETRKDDYHRRVRRVLEYLRAGDCYQVNLCHRLRAGLRHDQALPLYLRLRAMAPAPLGAYMQLDPLGPGQMGPILLSNSPELLLRADLVSGAAQTRPIKGTRRRGSDPADDVRLAEELLSSAKDQAEHLMIVDLLRNDLGRVAQIGSVGVDGFARLVTLPTVHHLVSTVRAVLRPEVGWAELLAALLPGGSITGAPKVRAMEIIDELEPLRRGPFYGALGFISPTELCLSLCIRTAVVHNDELVLAVGGGIVLDSTPQGEWDETQVKAAAFLRALA